MRNAAITNVPVDNISFELIAVPLLVAHIRVDDTLTDDDHGFKTINYQPHSDVTYTTIENLN
jgi:hypothetical protein